MIQHKNCLYCHKELTGSLACGCFQSKLKVVESSDFTPFYMNSIQRQDLMYVVKALPKIPNFDHEQQVFDRYAAGGWDYVDRYVRFVCGMTSNKPARATIIQKMINYITKLIKRLKSL